MRQALVGTTTRGVWLSITMSIEKDRSRLSSGHHVITSVYLHFMAHACMHGLYEDADRDGLALVEDITKAFRASAHPQVMEGCRDEEEVQQEFLETFAGEHVPVRSQGRTSPPR